ncbi:phosphate ABC transporter membrane protein, partial [human gut metagenome]
MLGVGRAIGEAMAVMMVSGNVPNMPSLFQSVRFLTTAVASEMSYSGGLQRQALFSIALVLYLFIMLINAALNFFLKRNQEGDEMKKKAVSGGRRAYILTMRILMGAAAIITAALVLFLIAYVLIKGLPNVSWTLLSTAPSYLSDRIGILPDILNTLYIVIATLLIVL